MNEVQPQIVAVSGTSGAGKSTIMRRAAARLPSVAVLQFDDYITLGLDPAEIQGWLERGADPDEIATPQLAADLAELRAGRAVIPPGAAAQVEPAAVVLLEEPFGRSRRELAPLVTLAAHIDLPADVGLARRLLRAIDEPGADGAEQVLAGIRNQLVAYLGGGREAYAAAERAAGAAADLVLDGTLPVDTLAAMLVQAVEDRLAAAGR